MLDAELSIYLAYISLGLLAIIPIYFGSFESVPHPTQTKKGEKEILSTEDAYYFPLIGSIVLFSFYLMFLFFSKDMINFLITCYFAVFGALAVHRLFNPIFIKAAERLVPPVMKEKTEEDVTVIESETHPILTPFVLDLKYKKQDLISTTITPVDMITFLCSILLTSYYVYSKNWIASNIFGEAFSIGAISLLHLDSFLTGMILLSGLFVYDIFWVFGTNVMVTVAKSFDAPIKVLFPRNLLVFTAEKFEFALLGLGDIVIPGIFVALCLRFDYEQAQKPLHHNYPKPYFYASFVSYIIGLTTTVCVMHYFQAPQPALLYLSPACILSVVFTGLYRRELPEVLKFTTAKEEPKETTTKKETSKSE